MEGILRSEEMAEIEELFHSAFDFSAQTVFFPVRHHSPACSLHLIQVIRDYKPDCVLVEGPSEANTLIDLMVSPDTRAPFAIYYSYQDKEGLINGEKRDYKCYYPFLDYSPELNAFREAKKAGSHAAFMDLPYHEILIYSEEGKGLLKEQEKQSYNDDYLLSESDYLKAVCEKQGLRSFDELWEKLFEINGRELPDGEFVKNMLAYCYLSRKSQSEEELAAEGCLARERYMAERIIAARSEYQRILVVTGGFHTYGLLREIDRQQEAGAALMLHGQPQKCYLMAYSMEAADRLNGYASGMPFPAFYQEVWKGTAGGQEKPYEESLLRHILNIGKRVRKKEGGLSTFDEICAFRMGTGLSALRGKTEPGAYELYDAILSCFVKGDYNLSTEAPITIFREVMTGKEIGALSTDAEVPPLLTDFEKQCKAFGFKIRSTLSQEITLDIFGSEKHHRESCFFSRLSFLETTFAQKLKGPSLRMKKNRNLVREVWKYKWHTGLISELIDKSVYGATVEEAAGTYLKEQLSKEASDAAQGARLLAAAFEMGLLESFGRILERLEVLLSEDGRFFSLVDCLDYLNMTYEMKELYQMEVGPQLEILTGQCFEKIVVLLPSMAEVKEEDCDSVMKACRLLYQLSAKKDGSGEERPLYSYRKERLMQAFETLLRKEEIHPKLEGTVMGLLYGADASVMPRLIQSVQGYMTGTHEKLLRTAGYLRGLFYGAKDIVFSDQQFLEQVDQLLRRVSGDEFMQIVPELRMAFSYFTPGETDEIAKRAAALYGRNLEDWRKRKGVSPEVFELGKELDEYTAALLTADTAAEEPFELRPAFDAEESEA